MKTRNKAVLPLLILIVLLLAAVAGMVWMILNYHIIDLKLYPKNVSILDLRGQEISIKHYKAVSQKLPDCEIRWDIPFQGGVLSDETRDLTVTTLTAEDVTTLDYLEMLETVDARGCRDYAALQALQKRRPEVEVSYQVELNGKTYTNQAAKLELDSITPEEIDLLQYLPELETVIVTGGENTENIAQLQKYCHEHDLEFCIAIAGVQATEDTHNLAVKKITDAELNLLQFLPNLEQLYMENPEASAENVLNLKKAYANIRISWVRDVCGKMISSENVPEEIDLSGAAITSLEQVEAAMAYFPEAKTVFLGECGIDNEEIAAFRERSREKYKVVWTVRFSGKLPTRTDTKDFFPARDGVYRFNDDDSYNLRYCEEIVCMDIGHMSVSDVSFLAFMPDLEYLILAHTQVKYIDGIENCKKLKFLELDWSLIQDLTPLKGCTALEDLNIGKAWPDTSALMEMPWLKNLYMIFGRTADAYKLSQVLTDTNIVTTGNATVGSNWRRLPNYYAMRDYLGVEYMN